MKLAIFAFGLIVGISGGVLWSNSHPDEANRIAVKEHELLDRARDWQLQKERADRLEKENDELKSQVESHHR